jgi:arsenate reductase
MKATILHNPRCSKSRESLQYLDQQGCLIEVVEYLKNPLSASAIQELLKKLNIEPLELIRQKEPIFKSHFAGKKLTNDEWIQAMVDFPVLIERPIVIIGDKAVIGRPIEKVIELIR